MGFIKKLVDGTTNILNSKAHKQKIKNIIKEESEKKAKEIFETFGACLRMETESSRTIFNRSNGLSNIDKNNQDLKYIEKKIYDIIREITNQSEWYQRVCSCHTKKVTDNFKTEM